MPESLNCYFQGYLKVCVDLKLTQKSLDNLKKMAENIVEKLG